LADGRMHADEVHTDVALVRRLLSVQFPEWAALPIERVASSGTDNALYRLGDDMVVRLPRIHWAVGGVDKDFRWLPVVAPLLPVAIPVPLAKGTPAEGYPWEWGVYRWLEGENPTIDRIADPNSLARDSAQFVEALHRIDLPGGPPATRGVPLAMRDDPTRTAIAFVERATRRPWKRCTSDQLVELAGELSTIHQLRQWASLDLVESSAPEWLPGGSHVRRA